MLLSCMLALASHTSLASAASRVVVVRSPGVAQAVIEQVRAELGAAGLVVVVVDSLVQDATAAALSAQALAESFEASGAVVLSPSGSAAVAAELWVAQRGAGVGRRALVEGPTADGGRLLALGVLEWLRASAIELDWGPAPRDPPERPPAEVSQAASQEELAPTVAAKGFASVSPRAFTAAVAAPGRLQLLPTRVRR